MEIVAENLGRERLPHRFGKSPPHSCLDLVVVFVVRYDVYDSASGSYRIKIKLLGRAAGDHEPPVDRGSRAAASSSSSSSFISRKQSINQLRVTLSVPVCMPHG